MTSNPINPYSSASEPGPSQLLTPSTFASPFTYHPAPNEPVPSHPFLPSGCVSPFAYPSTYSLEGEPSPSSRIACMSPYQSNVQAQNIFMNPHYNQYVPATTPTPSYAPVYSPVKPFTLKLLNGCVLGVIMGFVILMVLCHFHHMMFVFAMKNPER